MRTVKSYKCPCCTASYKSLKPWASHVRTHHPEWVIEGFSDQRLFYFSLTGKVHGNCIVCKQPTEWNEETGKYNRFCDNPKCKEKYKELFQKRMINKYGRVNLCNDPEQQRKMLANRHISGKVAFPDGAISYVGTYERDFLEMLRDFLHFYAADIMGPSPHTYHYKYDGEDHFYIPDFYIPNLNLEIEIKTHKTTHQKFVDVDFKKEAAKTEMMQTVKAVNYIVIADKDYEEFFTKVAELRDAVEEKDSQSDTPKKVMESQAYEQFTEDQEAIESVLADINGLLINQNPILEHFVFQYEGEPFEIFTPAEEAGIPEADPDKLWYPVYVTFFHTGTKLANTIKKATHAMYTHCAIAFDNTMRAMYSFGSKHQEKHGAMKGNGFEIDTYQSYFYSEKCPNTQYRVQVAFVQKPDFDAMKTKVRYFIQNQAKFTYDKIGLIKYLLHMNSEKQWAYFCSGFVADILKTGKVIQSPEHYSHYAPQRLADLLQTYCVAQGDKFQNYDEKAAAKNTKKAFEKFKKTYKLPESARLVMD